MSASGPTCHHTKPNGEPCGSPTLRGEQFCYYHHPTRRRPPAAGRKPRLPVFHLPSLKDRASIQCALAKVVSRVISGRLDRATARLIVFALQGASECLPRGRRQLGALTEQAQLALAHAPLQPLAGLLGAIRPPRRTKNVPSPRLTTLETSHRGHTPSRGSGIGADHNRSLTTDRSLPTTDR